MMSAVPSLQRVCIVDDEPGMRDLLELMCESAHLAATSYDCAETFLAAPGGGASDFDLIVLDVDMPGMSGLELLKMLRQRGFTQPVVMISGALDASKAAAAKDLGADAFFDKPFNVHVVSRRIRELLGHHRAVGVTAPDPHAGHCR